MFSDTKFETATESRDHPYVEATRSRNRILTNYVRLNCIIVTNEYTALTKAFMNIKNKYHPLKDKNTKNRLHQLIEKVENI